MPLRPVILVFGRDPVLLQTRRWILESAGFQALIAETLAETESVITARPIDLFLLCHSISIEDCQYLLAAAHRMRPEMELLLITANTPLCCLGRKERVVSAFDGPKALLTAIHELLTDRRTTGSSAASAASQG